MDFLRQIEKVSGSGDPFGIRRMALSIINLLINKKINLNLSTIFENLKVIYKNQNIKIKFDKTKILEFLNKRFEILLLEKGYESNVVKSCLEKENFNPSILLLKLIDLQNF